MQTPGNPNVKIFFGLILLVGFLFYPLTAEDKPDSAGITASKVLKLNGYTQIQAGAWSRSNDTFQVRRARFVLSGEIIKKLTYRVTADLVKSPALIEAQIDFALRDFISFRAGQFLIPFSAESVTSISLIDTINRSQVVDKLAPGRDNNSLGRDVGIAVYGRLSHFEYTVGLFNGSGVNKADNNEHKDFASRVTFRPLKFLSLGGSVYRGRNFVSEASPLVKRNKEGLEVMLFLDRFSVKSEYIQAVDGNIRRAGWYIQASQFLLKEKVQAVAKYDFLDLDKSVAVDASENITLGINWFLSGRTKIQANYEIHGKQAGGRDDTGFLLQFQVAF